MCKAKANSNLARPMKPTNLSMKTFQSTGAQDPSPPGWALSLPSSPCQEGGTDPDCCAQQCYREGREAEGLKEGGFTPLHRPYLSGKLCQVEGRSQEQEREFLENMSLSRPVDRDLMLL